MPAKIRRARAKPAPAPLIHIGASKTTIDAAHAAIANILAAPHADEATKRAALQAFKDAVAVNGVRLEHFTVYGGGK